jgi:hypothetical protein
VIDLVQEKALILLIQQNIGARSKLKPESYALGVKRRGKYLTLVFLDLYISLIKEEF